MTPGGTRQCACLTPVTVRRLSSSAFQLNGLSFQLAVTAVVAIFYATLTSEENAVRQMPSQLIFAPAARHAVASTVLTLAPAIALKIQRTSLLGLLISFLRDLLCHLLPVVHARILRRQYRESKFPDCRTP